MEVADTVYASTGPWHVAIVKWRAPRSGRIPVALSRITLQETCRAANAAAQREEARFLWPPDRHSAFNSNAAPRRTSNEARIQNERRAQ